MVFLQAIKQSVARRAIDWLRKNRPAGLRSMETAQADRRYRFWMDGGGYDRNVRNAKALRDIIAYIHGNSVRRGLVSRPEDWVWSSAADWAGAGQGLVPIDKETCLSSMV